MSTAETNGEGRDGPSPTAPTIPTITSERMGSVERQHAEEPSGRHRVARPCRLPRAIGPHQGPDQQGRAESGDLDVCCGIDERRMQCRDQSGRRRHDGSMRRNRASQPHDAPGEESAQDALADLEEQQGSRCRNAPDRVGRRHDDRIDGSLLRGRPVRPEEPDREPPPREEIGRDLAVLVGAPRDLVVPEDQDGRDPDRDRHRDDRGIDKTVPLAHPRRLRHPCRVRSDTSRRILADFRSASDRNP